jgi:hypothetical protein
MSSTPLQLMKIGSNYIQFGHQIKLSRAKLKLNTKTNARCKSSSKFSDSLYLCCRGIGATKDSSGVAAHLLIAEAVHLLQHRRRPVAARRAVAPGALRGQRLELHLPPLQERASRRLLRASSRHVLGHLRLRLQDLHLQGRHLHMCLGSRVMSPAARSGNRARGVEVEREERYLLLQREDVGDAAVDGVAQPGLRLVGDGGRRLAPVAGGHLLQQLGRVAGAEDLVDGGELLRPVLRAEVRREHALRRALAPQELARPARRARGAATCRGRHDRLPRSSLLHVSLLQPPSSG